MEGQRAISDQELTTPGHFLRNENLCVPHNFYRYWMNQSRKGLRALMDSFKYYFTNFTTSLERDVSTGAEASSTNSPSLVG